MTQANNLLRAYLERIQTELLGKKYIVNDWSLDYAVDLLDQYYPNWYYVIVEDEKEFTKGLNRLNIYNELVNEIIPF